MKPYPVFLRLEGRRALLVGGGGSLGLARRRAAWGDVTLAISTAGRSRALAGLLPEALDRFPDDRSRAA